MFNLRTVCGDYVTFSPHLASLFSACNAENKLINLRNSFSVVQIALQASGYNSIASSNPDPQDLKKQWAIYGKEFIGVPYRYV